MAIANAVQNQPDYAAKAVDDERKALADDPAPSREERIMRAVDEALGPAIKNSVAISGPVHHSELGHALNCVRQAISTAVYGPADAVDNGGESLDIAGMQKRRNHRKAVIAAQRKADKLEPLSDDELEAQVQAEIDDGRLADQNAVAEPETRSLAPHKKLF